MTLNDIESQVLTELGDINELETLWTAVDIQRWIYEAELKIARITDMLHDTDTANTSVANQANYDLPTDRLQIRKVEFDGYSIPYIELEELHLIDTNPDQIESASVPTYWYVWDEDIYFYPPPSVAGKTIRIHHSNYPTKLTTGTSSPTVPPEYHPLIVWYCIARGKEMEEETQDAIYWMSKFDAELIEAKYEADVDHADSYLSVRLLPEDAW